MKPVDDVITSYKALVGKIEEKYDELTVAQIKQLTASVEHAWSVLLPRGNDRRGRKS